MDYHEQAVFQFFWQRQRSSHHINSPSFSTYLLTPNPSNALNTYF